ncbi:hypothetical protein QBC40DRAFT_188443 [Triangularia verruculosa]|uniref:Uncharacterized protein n=1 Tax=Triangularia verruculosa TaxID=2587418 RepID=A0AAN7AML2_9PEZI|nr:hypothetical protein QBC40DRAFT_188443 [Triangularia verruculosa]
MKAFAIIALFFGAVSAGVAAPAEVTTTIELPPAATETRVSWTPETEHNSTISSDDKPRWHMEMFEATGINCNDKQWMSVRLNQYGTFCFPTEITIRRVRVINTGGCSTTYFSDEHCTDNPQHVERALDCVGYGSGRLIKSVVVAC